MFGLIRLWTWTSDDSVVVGTPLYGVSGPRVTRRLSAGNFGVSSANVTTDTSVTENLE